MSRARAYAGHRIETSKSATEMPAASFVDRMLALPGLDSARRPERLPLQPIRWPSLAALRTRDPNTVARTSFIGGSDANTILSGSSERITCLWREKRGEAAPEDLSAKLPVMLGCWTECFNRQWYELITGYAVSRVGEWLRCSTHAWRACTLDGYVSALSAVWEAKHTSSFARGEDLVARYMPQLQHNMAVVGCERAVLSVIFGNGKWDCYEIAADWLYQEEPFEAEQRFWNCVQSGELPVAAPIPQPPKPVGVREVCLEGNNAWATSAADWLQHRDSARLHAMATGALKDLVEDDVTRAFGHGVEAKRSKAGAITVREMMR